MSKNLIPLQTAYIRQSRDVENNTWIVFSDLDVEIGKLSNELDPKQAMSYLHFAKSFELEALNIGIEFGKSEEHKKSESLFQDLKAQNLYLKDQNERLSRKLEQIIIGKGEE